MAQSSASGVGRFYVMHADKAAARMSQQQGMKLRLCNSRKAKTNEVSQNV